MNNTVTIGNLTYSRTELEAMGREPLRTIARTAHKERGSSVSLTWLGSAAKSSDLAAFILGDTRDYGFGSLDIAPAAQFPDVANRESRESQAIATLASALQGFMPNGHVDREEVQAIVRETASDVTDRISAQVEERLDAHKADIARAQSLHASHVENRLNEVLELAKQSAVSTVRIEAADRAPIELRGSRHKAFDDLLADILAFEATKQTHRANFWLVGPAGTGKTTAAEKIADELGLPFYFNGAIDSEYKLRGFIDAQGRVIATPFRKAYQHGGVYLFDEVDSSLPSACLAFNAALANGKYDFPGADEPIARHKACIVLAASNTWGGPDGGYVGRFRQDAAFMDRFMRVPWETDEALEKALCANKDWCAYVQTARAAAIKNGVEHLVSPRATFNGDAMLAAGRPWERAVDLCVRKGLNDADWSKIVGEAR